MPLEPAVRMKSQDLLRHIVEEKAAQVTQEIAPIALRHGVTVPEGDVKRFMKALIMWGHDLGEPWFVSSFLRSYWFAVRVTVIEEKWADTVGDVFGESVLIIAAAMFGDDDNFEAFRQALEALTNDNKE